MNFTIRNADNRDTATVRALVENVLHEYGLAIDPGGIDADLDDIEANYTARGGLFRIAEDETQRIVGCVGLHPVNAADIELRKMYLLPCARGQGLGLRLLDECIAAARQRRYRRVVLETATVLEKAIALYEAAGFAHIPRDASTDRCDQAWALDL